MAQKASPTPICKSEELNRVFASVALIAYHSKIHNDYNHVEQVFVGVDIIGKPVFKFFDEMDLNQKIPVKYQPGEFREAGNYNRQMLTCHIAQVRTPGPNAEYTVPGLIFRRGQLEILKNVPGTQGYYARSETWLDNLHKGQEPNSVLTIRNAFQWLTHNTLGGISKKFRARAVPMAILESHEKLPGFTFELPDQEPQQNSLIASLINHRD